MSQRDLQYAAIRTLRQDGPMTRHELGSRINVDRSTARNVVVRLVGRGWATEDPCTTRGRVGRPSKTLRLNPEARVVALRELADRWELATVLVADQQEFDVVSYHRSRLAAVRSRLAHFREVYSVVALGVSVVDPSSTEMRIKAPLLKGVPQVVAHEGLTGAVGESLNARSGRALHVAARGDWLLIGWTGPQDLDAVGGRWRIDELASASNPSCVLGQLMGRLQGLLNPDLWTIDEYLTSIRDHDRRAFADGVRTTTDGADQIDIASSSSGGSRYLRGVADLALRSAVRDRAYTLLLGDGVSRRDGATASADAGDR